MPKLNPFKNNTDQQKTRLANRQELLILFFAVFITFLLIFLVLLMTYTQSGSTQEQPKSNIVNNTIDTAHWEINQTTPDISNKTFDIELTSSIGNIRTYTGLRSFGLSNSRQILATSSDTGIRLTNLVDNSEIKLEPPFPYSGDSGQVISWNYDNTRFAFTAFRDRDKTDSVILVFSVTGEHIDTLETNIPEIATNQGIAYPAVFAPTQNRLLVRTYSAQDLIIQPQAKTSSLEASLSVLNMNGETIQQIELGALGNETLVYKWGSTSDIVDYTLTNGSKALNFADPYLFTKVKLIN